jgi:hypothetical protein
MKRSAKIENKWSNPLLVARFLTKVTVPLANPDTGVIVRKAHVSQLQRYFTGDLSASLGCNYYYYIAVFFSFLFVWELRCVALLYVAVSYYLPFVLSLLVCGRWGSAAKLLMDTSGFSRTQRVEYVCIPLVPASGSPRLLLGLLVRATGR